MVLLVPITPEVPKRLRPHIWPGLLLAAMLLFGYSQTLPVLQRDLEFVANMDLPAELPTAGPELAQIDALLKLRPLLTIAPSRGDWSIERLLMANFIHGSGFHLALNILCAFAGARICSAFLPFATLLSLFTLGGTIGLFLSMFLSGGGISHIPHIGASAGIFALMGAYYIYNLRFRTRYFFWFPTRNRYFLSLPTATFFFVDVVLLEIVLSAAQIFPGRWDNVDHFAHVFGFMSGVGIACIFRKFQRWPAILNTRAEYFLYRFLSKKNQNPLCFNDYLSLLDLNSFNDPLKCLVISRLLDKTLPATTEEMSAFFRFISPTFMRYQTSESAQLISFVASAGLPFPRKWLHKLPYDLLIQIAYEMSETIQSRHALLYLFYGFIEANAEKPRVVDRVRVLTDKLEQEVHDPRTLTSAHSTYDV